MKKKSQNKNASYGDKNWTFVRRVFDTHQDLLDALRIALDMARRHMSPGLPRREDWAELIARAEEKP